MRINLIIKFFLVSLLIFTNKLHAQGGDNATAAASSPITLPFSASGTTCGHVDNYNPLSPYGITPDGKDWLYYFCAPTSGVIDIMMSNAYGTPPAVMVYTSTPNATGSNWASTNFTGANYMNSILSVTATAGSCYYVMIDNYPTPTFTETCIDYSLTIQYHVNPPAAPLQPACTNIGYDNGNLSGWIGTTGAVNIGAAGAPTPTYIPMYYGTSPTQHSVTSGAGVDPYGGFPIVNPAGGTNSIRLGDFGNFGNTGQYFGGVPGACGATLEQKFTVTASNALFVYYYAVVIQDAGSDHTNQEQPFFKTDIIDCSGNAVACGQYLVTGGPGIPGFTLAGVGSNVYWKNWSPVAVDLTPYIGTCVTVRYTVGDCTRGAHFAYAYIDAVCSPLAITGINKVCPTKTTVLSAPVGLFTYSWTPGGQTTQTVAVTPTTTTTYTCQLTSYANCQTFLTYSVSLYPAALASANSTTVCAGTAAALSTTVNNGAGTYTWAPSGGNSSSASVTPPSTSIYTVTYTDINGCQDTALSRVTVNPLPTMTTPTNVTVCHNGTIPASAFSSTVAGTTYNWTNSNTSIGLTSSGIGNTPSFTAINTGASPVNAVISVTPTANSCVGPPITYTIVVNPIPTVNTVPSATYCSGVTVPATNFTGSVTSTTYSWTNTNSSIGLGASGVGNIASFGATNSTSTGTLGVVTVTPSANSCVGTPTNFTLTVNPIPTVNAVPSATYCSGISVVATTFTGGVSGTTYNWTNSNTSIGLTSSGTGNTPSFTANNTSASPVNAIVSVTPTANSCVGTPISYSIIVNPIPTVNAVPSATYCSGVTVPATNFTGNVTSTTYSWSNTNSSIGLGASGVGNIASFGATNSTSTGTLGVVTVTPSANSCVGTPTNFTLTVNPIPTVNAVPNATYCSGISVAATTFTGAVSGTTYNWTNSNSSIGVGGSGAGTVPTFNATNNSTAPISGIITVTPSANSCIGIPTNYTLTVNPIPNVNAVPSATYCSGVTVPTTNFTGSVTSTTYSWSNTNSTIGLGASGVSNIASFSATNSTASGIFGVVTVTPSANTCSGTPINFTLTVNPVPTVNAVPSITACSGASVAAVNFTGGVTGTSYNWTNTNPSIGLGASGAGNILSFTASNTGASSVTGVISVTPSANSCIGTPINYSVTVNPNPLAPSVINPTVCPGSTATFTATAPGGTYNWYDNNVGGTLLSTNSVYTTPVLNVTTTYYVNVTNAFGCVSPYSTVTANVLNVLAVTASPNQTICVGANATLSVTPNGTGYTYSWDSPASAAFSSSANPVVTPTATTVYSVTVTSPTGCTGVSQTQVFVNQLPIAYAGNPILYCSGQSGVIGSAPISGYTYSWSPNTGLSSATVSNPTVTLSNNGSSPVTSNYTLTVFQNGCQASNQVQITVNPIPQSVAGSQITLCAGQSGTIGTSSNANYSYAWIPATNLSSASVSNPSVNGINSGTSTVNITYTVITTEVLTSCQSSAQVVVSVLPLPTVNAGSTSGVCDGVASVQLNGTVGGAVNSVIWSGGTGSFNANNTILNPSYVPSSGDFMNSSITLTLTALSIAPCPNVTSTVQIDFYKKPVINFIVNYPAGCPEHCVHFTDQSVVTAPDVIQSWSWNFGDGGTSSIQNPDHCYSQSGKYSVTLTATTNHMCSNTLTIPDMVEVYPVPVASFYATPPVGNVTDPNINFQNTSQGAVSYIWGFGDQFNPSENSSTAINPSHAYTNSGEYVVTLIATSNHGCEDRTSMTVRIDPEFTFYIPNCFTPESADGINDIFTGMGIGIEKYEMWVFDRWGEKIFYTDDIQKGWNGKRSGYDNVVQQDVYIWKVKLTDVFNKKHEYIGHVTLLK